MGLGLRLDITILEWFHIDLTVSEKHVKQSFIEQQRRRHSLQIKISLALYVKPGFTVTGRVMRRR